MKTVDEIEVEKRAEPNRDQVQSEAKDIRAKERKADKKAEKKATKAKAKDERGRGWADLRRTVRLLRRYSAGQGRIFLLAMAVLVFEAGTSILEAGPLAYLIDFLRNRRAPVSLPFELPLLGSDFYATIAVLTLAIVVIAMVNSAADSGSEILLARGGQTVGYQLRVALFGHLQRLSLSYHDRKRTGDVITRVTGDVKEVEEFVTDSFSDIAGSVLLLFGIIGFLLSVSWQVTLLAILLIPIMASISDYFAKRIKDASKRQRAREGDLASTTQEMLTSIRVVQTFGRGGDGEKRFARQSSQAMNAAYETSRLEAWFSWIWSVLKAVAIGAVVWIGVWLMNREALELGVLVWLVILIDEMFKPTRKIIKQWNKIGKLYASVERIADVLDREAMVKNLPGAKPAPALRGEVEFKDVSFVYQLDPEDAKEVVVRGERQEALRHVSFRANPGEVVALVGHSGAGKTSVAQLLPRLYDPQGGQVLIDGHDVRSLTLESLRSQISMVLQETVLFSGTVADNISYGRPEATRDEIVEAAIRANAHEFIEQMPEDYDTELSERASNLSGGQRQRIAVARAIIRGTPLLILDEPTTGMDAESTDLVLRGLRTLMEGRTTLLISHDLNLIRSADRILVLKAGEIVQSGSHDELMAEGGLYAYLYAKQFNEGEGPPPEMQTAAVERIPEDGRAAEQAAVAVAKVADREAAPVEGQAIDRGTPVETTAVEPARGDGLEAAPPEEEERPPAPAEERPSVPTPGEERPPAPAAEERPPAAAQAEEDVDEDFEKIMGEVRAMATALRDEAATRRAGSTTDGAATDLAAVAEEAEAAPADTGGSPPPTEDGREQNVPPRPETPAGAGASAGNGHVPEVDPLSSPGLQSDLPALPIALDARIMGSALQEVLLGGVWGDFEIESCKPGKATYVPGDGCTIRYKLTLRERKSGQRRSALVGARLFSDRTAAATFLRERVAPLGEAARGRPELIPFSTPATVLDAPPMVVYVWPIDAELPTLLEATDPGKMLELFRAHSEVFDQGLDLEACRIDLVHYPRRNHCLLRYELEGHAEGGPVHRVVYGKVGSKGLDRSNDVLSALGHRVLDSNGEFRVRLPRPIAFSPELNLALVESIPGVPRVGDLIKGRVHNDRSDAGTLRLEDAIEACARVAAVVHGALLEVGAFRTLAGEVVALGRSLEIVQGADPAFGRELESHLGDLKRLAASTTPLPMRPAHGAFTHTQVVFDGTDAGLLDFDTMCRAESALDLGQFCAYLRVAALKAERAVGSDRQGLGDELCELFLDAYGEAMRDEDAKARRARTNVWEVYFLLRMAARSWHQLKAARTSNALALLEERTAWAEARRS